MVDSGGKGLSKGKRSASLSIQSFRKFLSRAFCGGSKFAKIQKIQKISETLFSSPTRSQLYLLLEEGWEIDQITIALGVHSKSIERWEHNYKNRGSVNLPTPLRGCHRLLSGDIAEGPGLHKMLIESPSLLLDEIGEWLAIYHDQIISTTALHDSLRDLGLTFKRLKRIATDEQMSFLPLFTLLSSSPHHLRCHHVLLCCHYSLPQPRVQTPPSARRPRRPLYSLLRRATRAVGQRRCPDRGRALRPNHI
jgi:transposase